MLKNTIPLEAQPDGRKTGLVQLVKFAIVGGTGTGVHYLVLITLVALLHISAGYAAGVGAIAGACVNYVLNRRFTFGSHRPHSETLPRFALMAIVGAVLNGLLVGVLVGAGLYFLVAQAIATLVILILNFIVSKLWIFR